MEGKRQAVEKFTFLWYFFLRHSFTGKCDYENERDDVMYLFYLTLKTESAAIAIGILLYTVLFVLLRLVLEKHIKLRILCVLPALVGLFHFVTVTYGTPFVIAFGLLYMESLIPLLFLFRGKKKWFEAIRSATALILVVALCFGFSINLISFPKLHNYSRYSYTDSFERALDALEKEYVLNRWKGIDYDLLREEYMPRVEEAERKNDELSYAAVVTELCYRFYDTHVYPYFKPNLADEIRRFSASNDYGLSMIQLNDGRVISIFVEPDGEAYQAGIRNGTVILSWDNRDINEALREVSCIYPTLQFPVEENEAVFRPVFLAGKGGERVNITFINDEGMEKHVSVRKIGSYEDRLRLTIGKLLNSDMETRNYYTCMISDACGYLQIVQESYDTILDHVSAVKNGYYPELTEYYAGLISELADQGMKYLVVDIRNNMGGYDLVAGALASLFTDQKKHMVSFGYEDASGYHIKESQYIFPDGRYQDIPVVVLVNARCMSAGDGMAKFLGDCPNVRLMGITASSGVNQNNGGYIALTDNIYMCYPVFLSLDSDAKPLIDPDGQRENNIPLDVKIPMTKEMALSLFSEESGDVELEYVIEYLEKGLA